MYFSLEEVLLYMYYYTYMYFSLEDGVQKKVLNLFSVRPRVSNSFTGLFGFVKAFRNHS